MISIDCSANKSPYQIGGCLQGQDVEYITLKNWKLENNQGGTIVLEKNTELKISNATFKNNINGKNGGALSIENSELITINES